MLLSKMQRRHIAFSLLLFAIFVFLYLNLSIFLYRVKKMKYLKDSS